MRLKIVTLCFFSIFPTLSLSSEWMDEITVTASRTPVQKKEQGASITTISEEQIESRQLPLVPDVLRSVPGVSVNQSGGDGSLAQMRIRGSEANHTLVLIDGIEANDIARGSEFDFAHLSTCGLESIEVLRGPQSALWGSDALAGVVSMQTRRGKGPIRFETSTNMGSYNSYQNCSGISAGNEVQHFSLFGSYLDSGGINTSGLGSERDGYRNRTAQFRYGINFSEQLEFEIIGRHVDFKNESDQIPGDLQQDDQYSKSKQNLLRLQVGASNIEDSWTNELGIAISNTDNRFFIDGNNDDSTKGKKLKFDYQSSLRVPHGDDSKIAQSFTFAAEREIERFEQTGAPSFFGDPNQKQKIINNAVVGEYRFELMDKAYLSASYRRDFNDEFNDGESKRIAISYSPNQFDTRLHAAYGTAVKNPTFVERFGFTPDTFVGNPDLNTEESRGWEAGINHTFAFPLEVGLTYFSERLKDEINGFYFDSTLNAPFGGFTAVNQKGTSRRDGVELELFAEFGDAWQLRGAYTYLDAKQPGDSGSTREIRRPRNTASIGLTHQLVSDKGNIHLQIDHTGERIDQDFNNFPPATVKLSDYTLVSVSGSYQLNKWVSLNARVENLLDEEYQDTFNFKTKGINAHIGVKVDWHK